MKAPTPVEGFIQRIETYGNNTRLYELYYRGWMDEQGKLQLTACGGKSYPVSGKIKTIARTIRCAA